MAVAFAPCSKIENPEAKAVPPLAARHTVDIRTMSLVKGRKVTSLNLLNLDNYGTGTGE
jgi:hypothetical protein